MGGSPRKSRTAEVHFAILGREECPLKGPEPGEEWDVHLVQLSAGDLVALWVLDSEPRQTGRLGLAEIWGLVQGPDSMGRVRHGKRWSLGVQRPVPV